MNLDIPDDFFSILKGKHLLFDTTFFIDAISHQEEFVSFLSLLEDNDVTRLAIDAVKFEFYKGSPTVEKVDVKKAFINEILGDEKGVLPIISKTNDYVDTLIRKMLLDGASASITNLLLEALLLQYPNSVFLCTRNISDFPMNVFELRTHFLLLHKKAIQPYGIYSARGNL